MEFNNEKKEKNITYYRNVYFQIIEEIVKTTGYSKNEAHALLKLEVLVTITNKETTKDLLLEEWPEYIERVKTYLYEELDLIF